MPDAVYPYLGAAGSLYNYSHFTFLKSRTNIVERCTKTNGKPARPYHLVNSLAMGIAAFDT
jgi:hypothetical protein